MVSEKSHNLLTEQFLIHNKDENGSDIKVNSQDLDIYGHL